ncbi:MAG: cytochrome C biogenesis protein [Leptolinea sp.]|nr:cytochrome C biogenesis protein [Leptolinea sp.]
MDINHVKLEIFIPTENVNDLRVALANAGAGIIGNYDHCCSITPVRGYWRPLDGSNPYDGTIGEVSEGHESKVEVNCPRAILPQVIRAIRAIHPYEEPLINIVPLLDEPDIPE